MANHTSGSGATPVPSAQAGGRRKSRRHARKSRKSRKQQRQSRRQSRRQ